MKSVFIFMLAVFGILQDCVAINSTLDKPEFIRLVDPLEAVAQKNEDNRWTIETSMTFPIVRIYMVKAGYHITERSELGFGFAFQNWENEDESPKGQAHAYTLLLSYRYYFWRNFNAEIELWPAWNHFDSYVDGKTYRGPELWVEYKLGYNWNFSQRFQLNLQPGIGHVIWLQQNWPDVQKRPYGEFVRGSVIFVPQVLLGFKF